MVTVFKIVAVVLVIIGALVGLSDSKKSSENRWFFFSLGMVSCIICGLLQNSIITIVICTVALALDLYCYKNGIP